ncbi:MAG: hypothetical protein AB3N14_02855 [Flavobacteriaceae bacterium]
MNIQQFLKTALALAFSSLLLGSCRSKKHEEYQKTSSTTLLSPLGKELIPPQPSKKLLVQFETAKQSYLEQPDNAENIIWYGRRTAYLGRYVDAINIYTEGIAKFPEDARFYRHRGHRYISIREFSKAIDDLEKAGRLIEGKQNETEPDGMPNAQNIPVSSLHGNIWYHLGLAYYLKHDYKKAYEAYLRCRNSGNNADNIVSSTHWLYMIQRRLGNKEQAEALLTSIREDTEVIENFNYEKLCKFYKGLIPLDSISGNNGVGAASDATKYGIANWYFYNNDRERSKAMLTEIVERDSWSSFGYIAAESDLIHYFN